MPHFDFGFILKIAHHHRKFSSLEQISSSTNSAPRLGDTSITLRSPFSPWLHAKHVRVSRGPAVLESIPAMGIHPFSAGRVRFGVTRGRRPRGRELPSPRRGHGHAGTPAIRSLKSHRGSASPAARRKTGPRAHEHCAGQLAVWGFAHTCSAPEHSIRTLSIGEVQRS
jgi:hypothetical protein